MNVTGLLEKEEGCDACDEMSELSKFSENDEGNDDDDDDDDEEEEGNGFVNVVGGCNCATRYCSSLGDLKKCH